MTAQHAAPTRAEPDTVRGIAKRAVQIVFVLVVIGALLFAGAGRIDWLWGWAYLAIYLVSAAVNAWFLRHSPELVAERGEPAEAAQWDKVASSLWGLAQYLVLPLVAALDVRFGWTGDLALRLHIAGALVFAAGLALFGWAMIVNAYFSTAARIQPERGHTVCREGPYRFVRHPGYVGAILQSIGTPLVLGSVWSLLPAIAAAALMVARTRFEDRLLQDSLFGYPEYCAQVRHRLVPGVW